MDLSYFRGVYLQTIAHIDTYFIQNPITHNHLCTQETVSRILYYGKMGHGLKTLWSHFHYCFMGS